jgi:hypothetical protein
MKGPAKICHPDDLKSIVDCVIILHNMRIKYESEHGMQSLQIQDYEEATEPRLNREGTCPKVKTLIQNHERKRSRPANELLKQDLIQHVWDHRGDAVWSV